MVSRRTRHSRLTAWGAAWMSWVFSFLAIETLALRSNNPDATLSSHLRWVFGLNKEVDPPTLGRQVVGIGAWLWVLFHLLHKPDSSDQETP